MRDIDVRRPRPSGRNNGEMGSRITSGSSAIRHLTSFLGNMLMVALSISCVFPVLWLLYSSLKTSSEFNRDIVSLPQAPQFGNYIDAWRVSHMGTYALNSLFNAVLSLALVLLFSFLIGYFLNRFRFPGRSLLYGLMLFGMLVPIYALLIPIFIQFKDLGLYNQRFTLVLPYVAFGMPFSVFLVESYLSGIPREMEEAAYIDGCPFLPMLFRIMMPLASPILITIAILQFFSKWNEFPFALVLINKEALKTIPIGLMNFSGQYSTDYPKKMAALVLAVLPVLALYVTNNKRIIEGMTAGAVKG